MECLHRFRVVIFFPRFSHWLRKIELHISEKWKTCALHFGPSTRKLSIQYVSALVGNVCIHWAHNSLWNYTVAQMKCLIRNIEPKPNSRMPCKYCWHFVRGPILWLCTNGIVVWMSNETVIVLQNSYSCIIARYDPLGNRKNRNKSVWTVGESEIAKLNEQ